MVPLPSGRLEVPSHFNVRSQIHEVDELIADLAQGDCRSRASVSLHRAQANYLAAQALDFLYRIDQVTVAAQQNRNVICVAGCVGKHVDGDFHVKIAFDDGSAVGVCLFRAQLKMRNAAQRSEKSEALLVTRDKAGVKKSAVDVASGHSFHDGEQFAEINFSAQISF